jgi:Tfp pilus assembly protein PilO
MKERILAALATRDIRLVWSGMLLLIALLAFEGWHLVIRAPLQQYHQLQESRTILAALLAASPRPAAELERLAGEVRTVAERLERELRVPQSDDQLTAYVMAELDRSVSRTGAVLKGVKPGTRQQVSGFDEISYVVVAEGKYLTLCGWLMALEQSLGPGAAVTQFSMKATEAGSVTLTLHVAFYRPVTPPIKGS